MSERDEAGQVTVLIVGFAVVLMLAVGVSVDASAAYLQRQGLDSLADGAALAGAQEVRGSAVYREGLGERAPLDTDRIRGVVARYLRGVGAYGEYPGLRWSLEFREKAVVVRVTAPLDLPIRVHDLTDGRVSSRGSASVIVEP